MLDVIFPVGADLTPVHDGIRAVGGETANVCKRAGKLFDELGSNATIVTTAGRTSDGFVMSCIIREHLINTEVIDSHRIESLGDKTKSFDTYGEIKTFVAYLRMFCDFDQPEMLPTVHLVCRSWHLPRAYLLLRAQFEPLEWYLLKVIRVPVPSSDLKGIIREPFAWVKNTPRMLQSVVC